MKRKLLLVMMLSAVLTTFTVMPAMAATPEATLKAQQVVATIITPQMTELQKVQACNDYLKNTTIYNWGAYGVAASGYMDLLPVERADGPLLLGQGSCQGYSDAFMLMMNACGIPCSILVSEQGEHAWNRVLVGGQLLEIDVCWNDTGETNGYTLLTEQQMAIKHGYYADYSGTLEDYFNPYSAYHTGEYDDMFIW